jgi:hypothetical protein
LKITAPEQFSLTKNPEASLAFFAQIWDNYEQSSLFIDLSKITEITPESILYLLSMLDILRQTKLYQWGVRGNYPSDVKCRSLLCNSGFTEYIKTSRKNVQTSQDVLKIISGHKVDSTEVAKIENFIRCKLGIDRNQATKSTQVALMECVGNTFDHAYIDGFPYQEKWWAMAHCQEGKVLCAVLDNGVGISSTMRKTIKEKARDFKVDMAEGIAKVLGINLPITEVYDHELVLNAFTEPRRSRFKLKFRGKGLPKIFALANGGNLNNVFVISNRAFVNLSNEDLNLDLKGHLKGTLYSFEFAGSTKEDR